MPSYYIMYAGTDVTIVPYDHSQHIAPRQKFIYFVDEEGKETLFVASNAGVQHRHILEDFNREEGCKLNQDNLRGAGRIYQRQVDSWYSAGYDFHTPSDVQPRILELLGLTK